MGEPALTIALVVAAAAIGWVVGYYGAVRAKAQVSSAQGELRALKEAAEQMREDGQRREESLRRELEQLRGQLAQAESARQAHEARVGELRRNLEEQKALLSQAQEVLGATFKSLAADALKGSSEEFLRLAGERMDTLRKQAAADLEHRQRKIEDIIGPMRESLTRLDREIHRLDEERRSAQAQLSENLRMLTSKTERLANALSRPSVKGRWGEFQLRNVVEAAGMASHCDFREQTAVAGADGKLRPDMTINLPGGRTIVVDSKVPLQAYLEALDLPDGEQRAAKLADHARQVRSYIEQLSSKAYWDALDSAPEFVVLFLPGEMLFSAALQHDPALIEDGAKRKVILATPTTLIALLKAVAYGWRHEQLTQNAQRISELGQELHERLATMTEHLGNLGNSLNQSVNHYNKAVGSFEQRVLSAARRFAELGAHGKKEIKQLDEVDSVARTVSSPCNDQGTQVELPAATESKPT